MPVSIENVLEAYQWSSGADDDEAEIYIDRATGEVHVTGEYVPEDVPIPDDLDDETKYIKSPHRRMLDLGTPLVFRFAAERVPELYDEISAIFSRRGAYRRFKELLIELDRIDLWYQYEKQETEAALREWCKENGLELTN